MAYKIKRTPKLTGKVYSKLTVDQQKDIDLMRECGKDSLGIRHAPAQDKRAMAMVKKYSGQTSLVIWMLESWMQGYSAASAAQ